jgi:hypothetical protein
VVTGSVMPAGERAMDADLVFATRRSELRAKGGVRGERLESARIVGKLATADVLAALPSPVAAEAVLDLDLEARGPVRDPSVRGRVFAAEVSVARGGSPALRLSGVEATIEVSRNGLRCKGLSGSARGARFGGWGRVPFGVEPRDEAAAPLLALQIEGATAGFLAELGGAFGVAKTGAGGLPNDLVVAGELGVGADRSVTGSFALETERSALLLRLVIGGGSGELLGSTLRGRLASADAMALGLFPAQMHPCASDTLEVDARLGGTLPKPSISGRFAAGRISLETGTERPAVLIEDGSVLLDLGPEGLAWQALTGRLYGGTVSSSGRLARKSGALDASIAWQGVRVDSIPTNAAGESALAKVLAGACTGELRFARESRVEHGLSVRGEVTLADPRYLFVARFAPLLSRYRLPPIEARGASPATAKVRLERGEVVVEPIAVPLHGIDVGGVLRVREGGRLLGRLLVHLRGGYLSRSPLLAIPSAFAGDVVIPIYVRGTLGALDVQTDALEIFDGLLRGVRSSARTAPPRPKRGAPRGR